MTRSIACVVVLLIAILVNPAVRSEDSRKEDQSAFKTNDGVFVSSTAFAKLLMEKLDTAYQDLELVFSVCEAGEFGPRLKSSLGGSFSIITMSDSSHCTTDSRTKGNFDFPKGGPNKDIPGLHVDSHYYHGPAAQYVKKLEEGKNTVTNSQLYNAANNNDEVGSTPQYTSSGTSADNFTVHGGKSSSHAIVFSAGAGGSDDFGAQIANDLATFGLKQAGYTGRGDITQLSASTATKQKLNDALNAMRTALDAHPGEEKGYIYIDAHGSYQERTVAYQPGMIGKPGGGAIVNAASKPLRLLTDNPTLIANLQEDLPRSGGGFWREDPTIQRDGSPYFEFTTAQESFTGSTSVRISLDGLAAGTVSMGNSAGNDYFLPLSDALLDQLMPGITTDGLLNVSFALSNPADEFRLAVTEDWQQLDFLSFDYGLSIGTALYSQAELPEPPSVVPLILPLGIAWFLHRRFSGKQPHL